MHNAAGNEGARLRYGGHSPFAGATQRRDLGITPHSYARADKTPCNRLECL